MSIFVTGATGNVGAAVLDALVAAGERPIAGVTRAADLDRFAARGIRARVAAFGDPGSLAAAFAGVERLFLVLPLVEQKLTFARNLVAAARAAGVGFVLRSSGAAARQDSPYALMRLQAEIDDLVAGSGLPFAIGRPATFMQNTLTYYHAMLQAGTLYLPSGDGHQGFIDLRDLGRAYAAILRAPAPHTGRRYDFTGPAALGYAELAAGVAEVAGRPIRYVPVPEAAARASMQAQGLPPWNIEMLLSLGAACRDGALAEITGALAEVSGVAPTPFARFVADHRTAW